jgi:hypothetical protein
MDQFLRIKPIPYEKGDFDDTKMEIGEICDKCEEFNYP